MTSSTHVFSSENNELLALVEKFDSTLQIKEQIFLLKNIQLSSENLKLLEEFYTALQNKDQKSIALSFRKITEKIDQGTMSKQVFEDVIIKENNLSLLEYAHKNGQIEIHKKIVHQLADINEFCHAIEVGDQGNILGYLGLITSGALHKGFLFRQNAQGLSPLDYALEYSSDLYRYMVPMVADINQLCAAIANKNEQVINFYLDWIDEECLDNTFINRLDRHSESPLHTAAAAGNIAAFEALRTRGAMLDLPNDRGWTPFMYAVINDQLDMIKHMLALPEYTDYSANTVFKSPLWNIFVMSSNQQQLVNRTIYHLAVQYSSADTLDFLLDYQGNIDGIDECGRTALHYTALLDAADAKQKASLLVLGGADGDILDCEGKTYDGKTMDDIEDLKQAAQSNNHSVAVTTTIESKQKEQPAPLAQSAGQTPLMVSSPVSTVQEMKKPIEHKKKKGTFLIGMFSRLVLHTNNSATNVKAKENQKPVENQPMVDSNNISSPDVSRREKRHRLI